ncbi:50S ribosomal protein L5 [Candidatus Falkowbacteria bacterium]|nr:50S ribosomal protein L5 [Candidatus Falkowbacteria bacterium]
MGNEPRIKTKYLKEVIPEMKKRFGYDNNLAVPKIEKVVVTAGLSAGLKDAKFLDIVEDTLRKVTGQKPIKTLAKKSISNFKIRQGMPVGMVVTLRGIRMFDFIDKLINITFPRVRDFRGLSPKFLDKAGNLSVGFKEDISFPEIKSEEIEKIHGLQVTVKTTAGDKEKGLTLLKLLGFPFQEAESKK